jgi:hypothetical protein
MEMRGMFSAFSLVVIRNTETNTMDTRARLQRIVDNDEKWVCECLP